MINLISYLYAIYSLISGSIYVEVSYYSHPQLTANGEYFNPESLTCASTFLPFNTLVTLQKGNLQRTLRVNDRGPFKMYGDGSPVYPLEKHEVRVFDVSERAYRELFNGTESGTGNVFIISIEKPKGN